MANPFLYEQEHQSRSVFGEIIEALIVALIFNIVVYFLFIIPSQVDGPSMQPTLQNQELLFANKLPTWFYNYPDILNRLGWDYDYGDIVIFDYEDIVLVKRVIAVGGDKVKIMTDGEVYVNGKKMYENYLAADVKTYLPQKGLRTFEPDVEVTVPDDSFFVMGDNRTNSKDSRFADVGFISRSKIKGVVFFRFWPVNKIAILSNTVSSDNN